MKRPRDHFRRGHAGVDDSGSYRERHHQGRLASRHYGRLAWQLALAFMAVALVAVAAMSLTGSKIVFSGIHQLVRKQQEHTAEAAALGAAATYRPVDWAARLTPVIVVIDKSGSRMKLRNEKGQVVRTSPGYSRFPGPGLTRPVVVHDKRVGSVTTRFGMKTVAGLDQSTGTRRWETRLISGAAGILFALIATLALAPLITAPVDQVLRAARARSLGQRQARAGAVRGLRDLRELAATFDRMADNLGQEDQLRRNVIAYIAHDLRTPIAVLRASTEAMLDEVTPITPASVDSLHDEVIRLGQVVEDLRMLSAAEAASLQLKMSRHDLAAIAADTADSLASIFDAAQVRLTRQLSSVPVRCDEGRMRQVITNLLTNAAKFTPAGGQVTIEVHRSGDWAAVRISDSGVGIHADELPHLTERFYRAHGSERVTGTGIGLAIVDELVRAHQGTISIASEVGKGTQVTIEIPREV